MLFILYIQVELAHGGRGPSSFDRSSSYSSAGQRGASKRSDYRGLYFFIPKFQSFSNLKSLSDLTVSVH